MFGTKRLREIREELARRALREGIDPTELFNELMSKKETASQTRDADLLRAIRDDLAKAVRKLKAKPAKAKS